MRVTFFCFAKRKSPKKRRPYTLRPFAPLRATCGARGRGALRNSLCAARAARTTAASQFTKPVCPSAHRPPRPLRSSAHPEGNPGPGHPHGPLLRCAALGPSSRAQAPRTAQPGPSEAMARVAVWMFGFPPLLAAPVAGRLRGEHARRSAHASLSSSPWLSERRAAGAKRVPRRTPQPPRRRLPRSAAQGSQTGGRLFFGDFLLAKQKKVTRTPGDSRPPPSTQACLSNQHAQASTGLARTDRGISLTTKQ